MTNAEYMRKARHEQYISYPEGKVGTTTRFAKSLWGQAEPIRGQHPARLYLESRGLWPLLPGEDVRCLTIKGTPCLAVELADHLGGLQAIQYLRLTDMGDALLKEPDPVSGKCHKDRVTIGPAKGTGVWMANPCPEKIGVAEGLETAMAVRRLYDLPCWAALGRRGLQSFRPPYRVTELLVFADHDEAGIEGAAYLRDRLNALPSFGARAPTVTIYRPDQPGWDFADVWEAQS